MMSCGNPDTQMLISRNTAQNVFIINVLGHRVWTREPSASPLGGPREWRFVEYVSEEPQRKVRAFSTLSIT